MELKKLINKINFVLNKLLKLKYHIKSSKIKKIKYKISDTIRVKINKNVFDKSYKQNFSKEVYMIYKSNLINLIKIKDNNNCIIKSKYYKKELVLYNPNIYTFCYFFSLTIIFF